MQASEALRMKQRRRLRKANFNMIPMPGATIMSIMTATVAMNTAQSITAQVTDQEE